MKDALKNLVHYVLLGVMGFLPIALVFQIIVYIERVLREFVVLINGRYENPLVTFALFVAAIGFLGVFGRQLKNGNAFLLYYLEKLIQRIPLIGSIYRVTQKLLRLFVKTDESQLTEPPRISRRPIIVSHAAIADSVNC